MEKNKEIITALYLDFRDRCREVKSYVDFITIMAELKYGYISSLNSNGFPRYPHLKINRELEKTMRANALLLLYNLVEATMSNCVDSIHKAISNENLGFDELSTELKSITISHFKRAVRDNHGPVLDLEGHPIQIAMVNLGYEKHNVFSGNVDCVEIKRTAERYGFASPDPNKKGRKINKHLRMVKDKRNALAHGRLSFEQCGQEMAPDVLPEVSYQTIVYLRAIIWSVARYIRKQGYKGFAEEVA